MNTATVFLYKRTHTNIPPTIPSGQLTYSFMLGFTAGNLEGWESSLPVLSGAYRWVISARVASIDGSTDIPISAWGGVALLSEDGNSRYTATVYKQSLLNPGSPPAVGSSYDFATGVLIPPTGWSVVQPDTTTINTWKCEYTFIGLGTETVIGNNYWSETRIAAVAGIDGQNIHVITIYNQSDIEPLQPTGGLYTFNGDTFVAPSGWSRTMPTVSDIPTYMSTYRFSSNDPLEVLLADTWSYPVVIARSSSFYVSRFKSICFKYSHSVPGYPAGGTYNNPIPVGWYDGIPAYEAGKDLWMTARMFYADDSNIQLWSIPVLASTATNSNKIQFSVDAIFWYDSTNIATDGIDDTLYTYMRTGTNDGTGWVYGGAIRIKGEVGIKGDPGVTGSAGAQLYTWIAYAYDLGGVNGFTTGSPTSEHICIGVATNQTDPIESTDPTLYRWSKWVGADGQPGAKGTTTFTWYAYANSLDGTVDFTTGAWVDQIYMGLAFNKFIPTESQDPLDYTWARIGQVPPVEIPAPPTITGLIVTDGFSSLSLVWDMPAYTYFDSVEIFRSITDDINTAEFVTSTVNASYSDTPTMASIAVEYYYWLRCVNTVGAKGSFTITTATSHGSTANDPGYMIDILSTALDAISPVEAFGTTNIVIPANNFAIRGYDPNNIAAPAIYPFIVARTPLAGETPATATGDYAVFMNTASIRNATITSAKISDLVADKITAGDLTVTMNLKASGVIKSNNYSAGTAGWQINAAGNADFNGGTFRGLVTFTSPPKNAAGQVIEVDNSAIKVGGRNLVRNGSNQITTDFFTPFTENLVNLTGVTACGLRNDSWSGYEVALEIHLAHLDSGNYGFRFDAPTTIGKHYVLSGDIAGHRSDKLIVVEPSPLGTWLASTTFGFILGGENINDWAKLNLQFTATSSLTRVYVLITGTGSKYGDDQYLWLKNIKLEEGNIATAWTPAPEDVSNEITTKANAAEANAKAQELANYNTAMVAWAKAQNITVVSGRNVYTGGAFVDTLQINGNAVTVPVLGYGYYNITVPASTQVAITSAATAIFIDTPNTEVLVTVVCSVTRISGAAEYTLNVYSEYSPDVTPLVYSSNGYLYNSTVSYMNAYVSGQQLTFLSKFKAVNVGTYRVYPIFIPAPVSFTVKAVSTILQGCKR